MEKFKSCIHAYDTAKVFDIPRLAYDLGDCRIIIQKILSIFAEVKCNLVILLKLGKKMLFKPFFGVIFLFIRESDTPSC